MASTNETRLKNFPVSFFSMTMGLAGFTIATQKIEGVTKSPNILSNTLLATTICIFILLSAIYALKLLLYMPEAKEEFGHSVRLSFFPTFSISLLLISIALLDISLTASKYIWLAGMLIHLFLTLKILSIWMHHTKFEIHHMSPAWFIPVVGNILVPVAGVNHMANEVSWFFFSIGIVFWIVFFSIIVNRIIFHHPLGDRMLPTLFIIIAPPAVGCISYIKLSENVDSFAKILYFFALFLTLLLLFQLKVFLRIKFFISWWAFSFPVAAITIASMLMFHKLHAAFYKYISFGLFIMLAGIIATLLFKTLGSIIKKEICLDEH